MKGLIIMALTQAQKTELKRLFTQFDTDGSGVLTKKDFELNAEKAAALGGYGPGSSEYKALQAKLIEQWNSLKASADANDDGQVTFEEYESWQEKIVITQPEEFEKIAKESNRLVFDALDTDNSGTISFEEFQKLDFGIDEGKAKEYFDELDVNGNGSITREEFASMADWFTSKLG